MVDQEKNNRKLNTERVEALAAGGRGHSASVTSPSASSGVDRKQQENKNGDPGHKSVANYWSPVVSTGRAGVAWYRKW